MCDGTFLAVFSKPASWLGKHFWKPKIDFRLITVNSSCHSKRGEPVPRARPECVLYGVWNACLEWQSPSNKVISRANKTVMPAKQGRRGFSDLHAYQYPSTQQQGDKFRIVRCRSHVCRIVRAQTHSISGIDSWKSVLQHVLFEDYCCRIVRKLSVCTATRQQILNSPVQKS